MIRRFLQSLFIRLFLIYGFTFFLVIVTVIVSGKLSNMPQHKEVFNNYVTLFTNYVIDDIGFPPDTIKADSISQKLGITMLIEGLNFKWESTPHSIENAKHCHTIIRNGYTFTISKQDPFSENSAMHIYLIIGLIIVLLTNYFLVNSQFSPLKKMEAGVKEVGKGNFGIQVSTCGPRETKQLGEAFNDMSKKIEAHVNELRSLLRAISHELRSPLGRMKLALEFISEKKIKTSLTEEIDQLDTITASLLEQERLKSGLIELEKRNCNIVELLNQLVQPYSLEKAPITLSTQEPLETKVDGSRIALAIRSLIDNAIKYGQDDEILVSAIATEKTIEISVTDNGIGIEEKHISKLGEPFFRPDSSRTRSTGGFGLGLSIVKAIATAHGGELKILSTFGEGSSFTLIIPIC